MWEDTNFPWRRVRDREPGRYAHYHFGLLYRNFKFSPEIGLQS
jgi:hypothetical protein